MTTPAFFNQPNPPSRRQEQQGERTALDAEARAALMRLAAELGVALPELSRALAERGIAPNTEVAINQEFDKHSKRKKHTRVGLGWTVSSVKNHGHNERNLCLMQDGTMRMTAMVDDAGITEDMGALDFQTYPVHPEFETRVGFAPTMGYRSEILSGAREDIPFENDLYGIANTTKCVGVNLEFIERQVRTTGRLLLNTPQN